MKNYDVIDLAIMQVKKEGKNPEKNINLVIDRAFDIVKYFDIQRRNKKIAIKRYKKAEVI